MPPLPARLYGGRFVGRPLPRGRLCGRGNLDRLRVVQGRRQVRSDSRPVREDASDPPSRTWRAPARLPRRGSPARRACEGRGPSPRALCRPVMSMNGTRRRRMISASGRCGSAPARARTCPRRRRRSARRSSRPGRPVAMPASSRRASSASSSSPPSCCTSTDMRHPPQELEHREDHADVDRDHEVGEDRQREGDQQDRDVGARRAPHHPREMPHVAHVPGDDEQHRGQGRERHVVLRAARATAAPARARARARCRPAGCCRRCVRWSRFARSRRWPRSPPKQRRGEVGDALTDQLLVRVVPGAGHAVRDDGRQQRFDRAEHRDGEGRAQQLDDSRQRERPGTRNWARPRGMPPNSLPMVATPSNWNDACSDVASNNASRGPGTRPTGGTRAANTMASRALVAAIAASPSAGAARTRRCNHTFRGSVRHRLAGRPKK